MNCAWCKTEATKAARLPEGVRGKEYWPSCAAHEYLLNTLKLDKIDISELLLIERREQKAQQGAK